MATVLLSGGEMRFSARYCVINTTLTTKGGELKFHMKVRGRGSGTLSKHTRKKQVSQNKYERVFCTGGVELSGSMQLRLLQSNPTVRVTQHFSSDLLL